MNQERRQDKHDSKAPSLAEGKDAAERTRDKRMVCAVAIEALNPDGRQEPFLERAVKAAAIEACRTQDCQAAEQVLVCGLVFSVLRALTRN